MIKSAFSFIFLIIYNVAFGSDTLIPIITAQNALILRIDQKKNLSTIYYGKKLANATEYVLIPQAYRQSIDYSEVANAAYTTSGSQNLLEPAITVTHADGNNSLNLRYVNHEQKKLENGATLLTILLKDPVYNFYVTLCYKSYFAQDVIEQWAIIKHTEKSNVLLQKFASANLHIKAKSFWLTQYHGDWAKEMQSETSKLTHGIKTLDSKLGTRANLFQPSVFMVSLERPATEDEGTVLYGSLEYSGNFKTDFELDNQNNLRIVSGINNYASTYTLKPDEEFTTPAFLHTLSTKGKGAASRNLQEWARNYKILNGNENRLTLLNNWEATYFDFNESKLKELIRDTRKLGVDLFLLDDGWFANKYPRNGDVAGLGDWAPNQKKLPNGIGTLVKEATDNKVKFGIWIEPEMVNPKSELYEQHPDWVVKQPNRPEHYFRNQLVLDLCNPQVQDFVFNTVHNLFINNGDIAYIKWDCNSVIYNAHSSYISNQSHFYIEYMKGLYKVLKRIREKHPKVPMMLCSGGGGRVDYGALQYFTEFWPSDNTDPLERIFMQWEYSYFYPAIATANHVTDWGKQPIKFKTDVAMMGKLGFDIVVKDLSKSDLLYCQSAIRHYNKFKDIVWFGTQYRLSNPTEADVASMAYINNTKTKGVIFNYLVNNRYGAGSIYPIRLKGLDRQKKYKITEICLYPETRSAIDEEKVYTGDFLMNIGFNPMINAQRSSVILSIEQI
ncbi:alpha-galactosidase [Niabella insulamsoli]|uniref:alpha-galactosidase n=1 Tax=Niabella insulamsoli TaxID=3144874 RepID=UPI0031FD3AB5